MPPQIQDILPILRQASEAILAIYNDASKFNTEIKDDNSPVTDADKKANDIITTELLRLSSGVPVISEETKHESYDNRRNYSQYFLVDPLDGTKEFINRNGEFTINIAFMDGPHPQAGFIYVPLTNIAYAAEKGNGAFRINVHGEQTPLSSHPFFLLDRGIKVVASRSHRNERTENIISKLNHPEIVTSGSSKKFVMLAEGLAHFYPRLAPTMEWDTAAAQCILEESGGAVVRADDLQPLVYNKPDLLNPHFLAFGALMDPETLWKLM